MQEISQSGRPDSIYRIKRLAANNVMLSDECLILMPDGRELLWFDPELNEFFESTELAHRFKRCIAEAVKDFFSLHFSFTPIKKPSSKAGFQNNFNPIAK